MSIWIVIAGCVPLFAGIAYIMTDMTLYLIVVSRGAVKWNDRQIKAFLASEHHEHTAGGGFRLWKVRNTFNQ